MSSTVTLGNHFPSEITSLVVWHCIYNRRQRMWVLLLAKWRLFILTSTNGRMQILTDLVLHCVDNFNAIQLRPLS